MRNLWSESGMTVVVGLHRVASVLRARPPLIAFAALALSGCQTTKYIATPCIAHDQQIPAEPERVGDKLTGQADRDFQIVAGSAARLRAWGQGLNSIIQGCKEARP